MFDPDDVPPVDAGELLARYVLRSRNIRKDQTLKPDAFMPPSDRMLSVTRNRSATEEEVWMIGDMVASTQEKTIYGRGDLKSAVCFHLGLAVEADPVPLNPNHAHVVNWPSDKPGQKNIAQELAAGAVYVPRS